MVAVYLDKNESIDKALKKFKRKVKKSEILLEYQRRQYYTKPSDIKREKKTKSKLRNKYRMEREND